MLGLVLWFGFYEEVGRFFGVGVNINEKNLEGMILFY